MKQINVLAKVSESCPLRCIYCYEGSKSNKVMDKKTLERMVELLQTRVGGDSTEYIWHGAEPLTAGIAFYKRALELQERFGEGHKISNSMQSSGVLLTPEFADVLVEGGIGLGFSLDGPEEVHNKTRRFASGRSSFKQVLRGIELMRARGEKVGVIAVLTKLSLPHLDDMYDFFKSTGLSFKINPILDCGFARGQGSDLHLSLDERTEAICHLFDRWFFDEDGRSIEYGNMKDLVQAMFTRRGTSCNNLPSCQSAFLSIGADGTVYPCSRFDDLNYGNINTAENLDEVLQHPLRVQLLNRFETISECQPCDYSFLCHGGCMHTAYLTGDIMEKDPSCLANKRIYEHIAGRVLDEIKKDGALLVTKSFT